MDMIFVHGVRGNLIIIKRVRKMYGIDIESLAYWGIVIRGLIECR